MRRRDTWKTETRYFTIWRWRSQRANFATLRKETVLNTLIERPIRAFSSNFSALFFQAKGSDSIKESLALFCLVTPAESFLNRRLKTRLNLMRPDLGGKVFDKQSRDQNSRMDKGIIRIDQNSRMDKGIIRIDQNARMDKGTKSIITGIYPTEWKTARVTTVFKEGVKSELNNYRPISVISVVSKVFEKIVYDQLYQYLNDNKLLSGCQSGFRSLHSTLTALLEATNSWSVNIDNGFLNGVVFIDLKKAFDTIDHEIILRKLSYFGADQATIKWFQSYLTDRTERCNVNGNLSTASSVTCGVPQGSILGPLLSLMYINDRPNCLRDAAPRMFACDTNITLSAKTVADLKLALTSELNNLTCWLRANRLSLNVAKTELMIIEYRQRLNDAQCEDIDITIGDKTMKRVDHTKSVGLTIDAQLSWSKHVDEICKKASSAIGALKRVSLLFRRMLQFKFIML